MTTTYRNLRNVSLEELLAHVEEEKARKVDLVVARDAVSVEATRFLIAEGPGRPAMSVDPTDAMLAQFADRTKVGGDDPAHTQVTLLRDLYRRANRALPQADVEEQMRADFERAEWAMAFDALVNAKLAYHAPDRFMLRTFRNGEGDDYTGRALLGKTFRIIDHEDTVTSLLAGLADAGLGGDDVRVTGDLTANRLNLRIAVPAIHYVATELMKGYRSPFRAEGETNPIIWAGIVVTNSETGWGSCSITPRFVALECDNGLTITRDAMRSIHLGGALEEGLVFSDDTRRKASELVRAKVRDAVSQFLSADYLEKTITEMEAKAATPLEDPVEAVEVVAQAQGWTEEERKGILGMFIKSGQVTAGGVMQAMTAFAQTVEDPDRAMEFEARAIGAMELVSA